jgi:biopolymer transport protein ExbD
MGMSVKTSSGGEEGEMSPVAEINVTPLVDVMLVLLIIFMVTMPVMMSQLPIMLPKVSLEPSTKTPPLKVQVYYDNKGQYSISQGEDATARVAVEYSALPAQLKAIESQHTDALVTVCADKDVIYDKVVDLMGIVSAVFRNKVSICP